MIVVDRKSVPKPGFFSGESFIGFRKELAQFHREGGTRSKQAWFPWRERLEPFLPDAMQTLRALFHDKCAYTEVVLQDPLVKSSRGSEDSGKLILHRPPGDAIGTDGKVSPEHYWWLITEWTNWVLASNHIASVKETQFPVSGERAPVPQGSRFHPPKERSLLLDPCSADPRDHPAWHLAFARSGMVGAWDLFNSTQLPSGRLPRSSDLPGVHTIRALDLNNPRLVSAREKAAMSSRRPLLEVLRGKAPLDSLEQVWGKASPFAGAVRQACALFLLSDLDSRGSDLPGGKSLATVLPGVVEALQTELACIIVCERKRRDFPTRVLRYLAPLKDHLQSVFPSTDLPGRFEARLGIAARGRAPLAADGNAGGARPAPAAAIAPNADANRPVVSRSAQITTITIKNFRAIAHLTLSTADLDSEEAIVELAPEYGALDQRTIPSARRWWSLLGENGTGKSSILQAIALALAGENVNQVVDQAGLQWRKLLRRPPPGSDERVTQGRVCLDFSDSTRIDLRFNANRCWWVPDSRGGLDPDNKAARSGVPIVEAFVRAYGATRLLESDVPGSGHVRVTNLFDPRAGVSESEKWLLSLSDDDFNVAAPTISNLLHHEALAVETVTETTATGRPLLTRDRNSGEVAIGGVPFELASDGYKAVVALACDIMSGLGEGLSTLEHAPGIVLIDEIGAHLHPRWRMAITGKLRRALPNVQFIVSTHEPLCLRGLVAREVVRIEKHPRHGVLTEVIDRSPSYYRVDQLLTSEFFGLDTTIEPDLERRFQHYYRLLALETRSPSQDKDLAELFTYLQRHARPSLGYTRREQLVYDEIDHYLSTRFELDDPNLTRDQFVAGRQQRRRAALQRVRDIWTRRLAVHNADPLQ